MEILCHPHESRNKAGILPNRAENLPSKEMAILAPDPASRIPKTFHRTPLSTKVVTAAKADLRVPVPTSARLPKKLEHLPAQ